jgi:transcriptional antiterminator/mannitol/fructose-specific phosphotransferase system IIA component (Ntr-type)
MLLLHSSTPLAAADLASQLGISARVVREHLPGVRIWLEAHGAFFVKGTNHEFSIDTSPRIKSQLTHQLESATGWYLVLSPEERLWAVALNVLTSQNPLVVKQFETQLKISRSTALKDLDGVEKWLGEHKLGLIRRPNYGVEVQGSEQDRREAIVSILLESAGETLLLALCLDSFDILQWHSKAQVGLLRTLIQDLDLIYAKRLVDSTGRKYDLQFADQAYVSLVLNLALVVIRVQQNRVVEASSQNSIGLKSAWAFEAAKFIAEKVKLRFAIKLPDSEVAFVANQLSAATAVRARVDLAGVVGLQEIDPALLETLREMVVETSHFLHPAITADQSLIQSLALHVQLIQRRLRLDVPIRNFLLDEVKSEYPYVFKVVRRTSSILEKVFGMPIPEEEIGFIAMHFAASMERLRVLPRLKKRVLVVCGEGIATAWLLVSKLRGEVPELEIIGVMSLLELRQNKTLNMEIDAIISTIPIDIRDVPVVVVRSVLGMGDIATLRRSLGLSSITDLLPQKDSRETQSASLLSLITPETIRLNKCANKWQDAVDLAAEPLLSVGAIDPSYVTAMKALIVKYGPYSVTWPGVILLHGRPGEGVKHLCMSLTTFRSPVNFGETDKKAVDVAVVLGAHNTFSHLRALEELANLLGDKDALQNIKGSCDKDEILAIIAHSLFKRTTVSSF